MKTIKNKKAKVVVCAALVIFVLTPSVFAQEDDTNAALLYLRAFLLYEEPAEDLSDMLEELRHGNIKPNDQIREYLEKNKPLIELVTTASKKSSCDWGWDLSNINLVMPELSYGRKMAFMLVYDSKVLLDDGDYKSSLERCLTIYRMAGHFGGDLIVSNLVSMAMSALASVQIKSNLSQMPADVETLEWLKRQMQDIPATTSMISAILNESKISVEEMRKEKVDEILENPEAEEVLKSLSKEQIEETRNGNEAFFEENRKYYLDFIASVQTAFALPYEDAYRELEKLNEKVSKDAETDQSALIASVLSTPFIKLYTNEIRKDTEWNATNAAIDIYLIKARTGQLPDELPVGLPKDMFSSKDFIYEKTDDGFILRCQGKNLMNDEIYEYEFKVKK